MASVYETKLANLNSPSEIAADVKQGKQLLAKYGPWIRRYAGGMPPGILARIMAAESGGRMDAPGDQSLGEAGFYQITKYFPPSVGLPAASRLDPETNVFLGSLEYQIAAARMARDFPSLVELGSEDNWKLARLDFAVGSAGARKLIRAALARGGVTRGHLYDGIRSLVDSGGSMALSSGQPADKVWFRVHFIDSNFDLGQRVERGSFGSPETIPAPLGVTYRFPPELMPFANKSGAGAVVVVLAAAAAAWWLTRRRSR